MRHTSKYTHVDSGLNMRATWWQIGDRIFRHRITVVH